MTSQVIQNFSILIQVVSVMLWPILIPTNQLLLTL